MGMTITEKILAAHAGVVEVAPGEIISARVDIALGNDITAPLAIQAFGEMGAKTVFDKDKVILVPDHFAPNKDIQSAEQCRVMRAFAREQQLAHYFEVGRRESHLYLWRPRGLCHRRRQHRSGRGHGNW
jgi:3-isopropylmalate/(R)-2-methylmalate dehydratase large subunit